MKKYLNLTAHYDKITLEQFKENYNALSKTNTVTVKASNLFPRIGEGSTTGKYDALIYYSIEESAVNKGPTMPVKERCDDEPKSVMKGQGPGDMPGMKEQQATPNEMDVF